MLHQPYSYYTDLLSKLKKKQFGRNLYQDDASTVQSGHSLEIVNSLGKVRASITLQPPVEVDGKKYPQTVLLRLISSNGKPLVKLGVAEDGSGLSLIDGSGEGVLIHQYRDLPFLKLPIKEGADCPTRGDN